jgi:hypothetical protein
MHTESDPSPVTYTLMIYCLMLGTCIPLHVLESKNLEVCTEKRIPLLVILVLCPCSCGIFNN